MGCQRPVCRWFPRFLALLSLGTAAAIYLSASLYYSCVYIYTCGLWTPVSMKSW